MFGTQNYTPAWAWLPSATISSLSILNMANYDAVQVRPYPPTPAPRSHHAAKALHKTLPPFAPYVSASLLPQIALVLLVSTFALTFYFSTSVHPYSLPVFWELMCRSHSLPKDSIPIREGAVASLASILGGFGVVALFCSVGVNV